MNEAASTSQQGISNDDNVICLDSDSDHDEDVQIIRVIENNRVVEDVVSSPASPDPKFTEFLDIVSRATKRELITLTLMLMTESWKNVIDEWLSDYPHMQCECAWPSIRICQGRIEKWRFNHTEEVWELLQSFFLDIFKKNLCPPFFSSTLTALAMRLLQVTFYIFHFSFSYVHHWEEMETYQTMSHLRHIHNFPEDAALKERIQNRYPSLETEMRNHLNSQNVPVVKDEENNEMVQGDDPALKEQLQNRNPILETEIGKHLNSQNVPVAADEDNNQMVQGDDPVQEDQEVQQVLGQQVLCQQVLGQQVLGQNNQPLFNPIWLPIDPLSRLTPLLEPLSSSEESDNDDENEAEVEEEQEMEQDKEEENEVEDEVPGVQDEAVQVDLDERNEPGIHLALLEARHGMPLQQRSRSPSMPVSPLSSPSGSISIEPFYSSEESDNDDEEDSEVEDQQEMEIDEEGYEEEDEEEEELGEDRVEVEYEIDDEEEEEEEIEEEDIDSENTDSNSDSSKTDF